MISEIAILYDHFLKYPSISTDSRKIKNDSIFFALKGDNFNGNDFAMQSLKQGCSLAVVDDPALKNKTGCFYVANVLDTLQSLAIHHRKTLSIPMIGITGTNGKPTTKELINAVLSKKFKTYATQGNFNNHIGVPLSILSIHKSVEIAVIEMGANHIGEIARLCEIARPNYGIITNIGIAHLEGFGSFEGVVKAKTELYHFLSKQANSVIFVNKDDELLQQKTAQAVRFTYGLSPDANIQFRDVSANPFAKVIWTLNNNSIELESQLIGSYNAPNIMAAVCVGHYFNIDAKNIKEAIENYHPENQRSQFLKTHTNKLIVDAYNANPSSMIKAIDNFKQMQAENKLMILGDMFELGNKSKMHHQQIIDYLKENSNSEIILVGKEFSACDIPTGWSHFLTTNDIFEFLSNNPIMAHTILLKGSRGMKLETLIKTL